MASFEFTITSITLYMLRTLLFFGLLVSSLSTFAQTTTPQRGTVVKSAGPVAATATSPKLVSGNNSRSVVLDTIFPAALSLDCARPTLFFSDTTGTQGYITGSNQFDDFEKLQRITLPEAVDVTVNQAVVAFAIVEDSIDTRDILVKVYTDLGADGNFGQLVGISDTLQVSDIRLSDTALLFTTFNFSEPAVLENVSSFLLSVEVAGVYFDENDAFDPRGNVGIFSTPSGCGDGNNLFEIFPDGEGGLAFNSVFNNWGMLNIEMYVGAIIDRGIFTSTRTATADYAGEVFPNPVGQELNISFSAPASGDYSARIVSTTGSLIQQRNFAAAIGPNQVNFDVANLPAGIYLFQVEGVDGVQTGKFLKR